MSNRLRYTVKPSAESNDDVRRPARGRIFGLPGFFVALVTIVAIFGPTMVPSEWLELSLSNRNISPLGRGADGTLYLMGSDALGRNQVARIVYGSRLTIIIAMCGAAAASVIGVPIGVLAGYYGGLIDQVAMRVVDSVAALPTLLIALFVLFVLGPSVSNLILVLVLVRWVVFARLARGLTLNVRGLLFVDASRAIGNSDWQILRRHVWPNIAPSMLVLFFLEVAVFMLAEASLSFLGFGVRPPDVSWGLMIAEGRAYIREASWLVTLPGVLIFATVWSSNIVGHRLRSAFVHESGDVLPLENG